MSAKKLSSKKGLKTWIELDSLALRHNIKVFRKLIGPRVKLYSVVKSNAYGHGLFTFATLAEKGVDGFCVDSVFEGKTLRETGITKPILVLGMTLPENLLIASAERLTITISNFEALKAYLKSPYKSECHIKIDTGMHRQGFRLEELSRVIREVKSLKLKDKNLLKGIYTHFASAKDVNYPTYTEMQYQKFQKAVKLFQKAGFKKLFLHAANSGGSLINKKYHLDMVRVGMGLYGYFPSKEFAIQLGAHMELAPVLTWKTIISEIKTVKKGEYVSYDLTERLTRDTKVAILPIGYWHGFPWVLSSVGEVVINGRRAKVLGRVTMDVVMVDVTSIKCKVYDEVVIDILDSSLRAHTSYYEFLTRINPLIERIVI